MGAILLELGGSQNAPIRSRYTRPRAIRPTKKLVMGLPISRSTWSCACLGYLPWLVAPVFCLAFKTRKCWGKKGNRKKRTQEQHQATFNHRLGHGYSGQAWGPYTSLIPTSTLAKSTEILFVFNKIRNNNDSKNWGQRHLHLPTKVRVKIVLGNGIGKT